MGSFYFTLPEDTSIQDTIFLMYYRRYYNINNICYCIVTTVWEVYRMCRYNLFIYFVKLKHTDITHRCHVAKLTCRVTCHNGAFFHNFNLPLLTINQFNTYSFDVCLPFRLGKIYDASHEIIQYISIYTSCVYNTRYYFSFLYLVT